MCIIVGPPSDCYRPVLSSATKRYNYKSTLAIRTPFWMRQRDDCDPASSCIVLSCIQDLACSNYAICFVVIAHTNNNSRMCTAHADPQHESTIQSEANKQPSAGRVHASRAIQMEMHSIHPMCHMCPLKPPSHVCRLCRTVLVHHLFY